MRILHVVSDFRLTGPVEPVFNMVASLRQRGIDARLAISMHPPKVGRRSLADLASERGLNPILLNLTRYFNPLQWWSDLHVLRRYLVSERIDLLHTHLSHDHWLGAAAAKWCGPRVLVIRTNHKGRLLHSRRWFPPRLMAARIDAYVGFSRLAAEDDRRFFNLPAERIFIINPAIDLDRFNPAVPRQNVRASLGLDDSHIIGAIVARVQRHRRWTLLIEAVRQASARCPKLRILVIGSGTHRQKLVIEPAQAAGLDKVILCTGYRRQDYVDFLASIDFKILLQPGSDGTCRAVREALAMGKPAVVTRVGMLPELVPHEHAGLVVDPQPDALAAALVRLCEEPQTRRRMGTAAREHALANFSQSRQTDMLVAAYNRLMEELSPPATDTSEAE